MFTTAKCVIYRNRSHIKSHPPSGLVNEWYYLTVRKFVDSSVGDVEGVEDADLVIYQCKRFTYIVFSTYCRKHVRSFTVANKLAYSTQRMSIYLVVDVLCS